MSLLKAPVTLTIIIVNVIVFVADLLTNHALLAAGALYPPAVQAGEWWRLITSGFLHYGFAHIGSNMLALAIAGPLVEYCYGGARYFAIYMIALLGGSFLAFYTTLGTNAATAGASGAIMGVFGAMVVLAFKLPRIREALLRTAVFPIILTIGYGFVNPGVSMAGHIGGLLAGSLAAFALDPVRGRELAPAQDVPPSA